MSRLARLTSMSRREQSDEVINLFGLAMRSGLRATDLKHILFSYPTRGSELPHML